MSAKDAARVHEIEKLKSVTDEEYTKGGSQPGKKITDIGSPWLENEGEYIVLKPDNSMRLLAQQLLKGDPRELKGVYGPVVEPVIDESAIQKKIEELERAQFERLEPEKAAMEKFLEDLRKTPIELHIQNEIDLDGEPIYRNTVRRMMPND